MPPRWRLSIRAIPKLAVAIDQKLGILAFRHQLRMAVEGPLAGMYGILYFYFRVHFPAEVLV